MRRRIVKALKETYDPEVPVSVYDLGLIYGIDIKDDGSVKIRMTFTTPACPLIWSIGYSIENVVKSAVPEAKEVKVEIVWDPPWTPKMVTKEGRERLKEIYGYDVVEEWIKSYS